MNKHKNNLYFATNPFVLVLNGANPIVKAGVTFIGINQTALYHNKDTSICKLIMVRWTARLHGQLYPSNRLRTNIAEEVVARKSQV